jgi:hypothetical protein
VLALRQRGVKANYLASKQEDPCARRGAARVRRRLLRRAAPSLSLRHG